jgi:hypothetical protein
MLKSTPRLTVTISWSAILWMAAQGVHAQPPAPPFPEPPFELKSAVDAVQKACKGDFEKLCPGKNGPDAVACLKSNEEKLSSECKQAVSKAPKPSG